jgi:hypothetical protein
MHSTHAHAYAQRDSSAAPGPMPAASSLHAAWALAKALPELVSGRVPGSRVNVLGWGEHNRWDKVSTTETAWVHRLYTGRPTRGIVSRLVAGGQAARSYRQRRHAPPPGVRREARFRDEPDVYRRRGDRLRRWGRTVAEDARASLRPGDFGSATRVPLENGAAGHFPLRLSCSISAYNSAIWRCSSATNAGRSSRLNDARSLGKVITGIVDIMGGGRKPNR